MSIISEVLGKFFIVSGSALFGTSAGLYWDRLDRGESKKFYFKSMCISMIMLSIGILLEIFQPI